jgi:chromosomal replication initiation ATPase DnaA
MISPNDIINTVSLETGIPIEVIMDSSYRIPSVVNARYKCYKLLNKKLYMSANKISKIMKLDVGTIRNALNKA